MYRDKMGVYHKKPEHVISQKRQSVYGIFIKNKKILLVKPIWIDMWELPGGGADEGENIQEAVKREFIEETGFTVTKISDNPIAQIQTKFYQASKDTYFESEVSVFLVQELSEQNKSHIDTKEIKEVRMAPITELSKKNMTDFQFEILESVLKQFYNFF